MDNYRARPTAANLQMPSLDAKVAGTPLNSSQSSSDAAAAVEYYEEMPTVADQVVSPYPKVEETPLEGAQPSSDAADIDYYEGLPTAATQQTMPPVLTLRLLGQYLTVSNLHQRRMYLPLPL